MQGAGSGVALNTPWRPAGFTTIGMPGDESARTIPIMEKVPCGFPCPVCGTASLVYSTKQHANTTGWSTRRYRKCEKCAKRFTTVELLLIKDEE